LILQVRDIVLGHVVPQKLKLDDLMAMPEDEVTTTLLKNYFLKLSTAGAIASSKAGESTSGIVSFLKEDINACAPNSTMHTIEAMLPIAILALPPTASPLSDTVSGFHQLIVSAL
jgi:hypothetical protein